MSPVSKMVHLENKAFTLVEILVVIAVIGLLGSAIFAVTRGTGEQGRIARGLYFDQHLRNSLGAYTLGIWNFDEGSGAVASDTSGWGNNGTIYGSVYTTDTPSAEGYALSFNGSTDYVDINISPQPVYEVTLSAWIYPNATSGLVIKRAHCDGIYLSGTTIYYYVKRSDHSSDNFSLGGVQQGKWNFIAAGVNLNTQKIFLSVNGNYSEKNTGLDNSITLMSIGGDSIGKGTGSDPNCPNGTAFTGLIDEVRIYERTLGSV